MHFNPVRLKEFIMTTNPGLPRRPERPLRISQLVELLADARENFGDLEVRLITDPGEPRAHEALGVWLDQEDVDPFTGYLINGMAYLVGGYAPDTPVIRDDPAMAWQEVELPWT
jgi:hypothetical protein